MGTRGDGGGGALRLGWFPDWNDDGERGIPPATGLTSIAECRLDSVTGTAPPALSGGKRNALWWWWVVVDGVSFAFISCGTGGGGSGGGWCDGWCDRWFGRGGMCGDVGFGRPATEDDNAATECALGSVTGPEWAPALEFASRAARSRRGGKGGGGDESLGGSTVIT